MSPFKVRKNRAKKTGVEVESKQLIFPSAYADEIAEARRLLKKVAKSYARLDELTESLRKKGFERGNGVKLRHNVTKEGMPFKVVVIKAYDLTLDKKRGE